MDHILCNLRAVPVKIGYNRLEQGSSQLEGYSLVMDNRPVGYQIDDGGDQDDPRFNPFNHDFLIIELRRPYCTPDNYNMSSQEFTDSNLYCMSDWHTGTNRFALTTTVNLTEHNTKVSNDREWIAAKASHSEFVRLDTPTSLNLYPRYFKRKTFQLYQR